MSTSENQKSSLDPNQLWIHCFKCTHLYVFKDRAFFLLSCKHIICVKCLKKVDNSRVICLKCRRASQYSVIGNDMPRSLKKFFHPRPWDILDWDVINFQNSVHLAFLKTMMKKVNLKYLFKYLIILKLFCRKK